MQTLRSISVFLFTFIVALILGVCLTFFVVLCTGNAQAATLVDNFRNDDNDLICVYEKHFEKYYVNVGFDGHCSFNIPDSKLEK